MPKLFIKIISGFIWLYRYHIQILPKVKWSDVRWGLLQVYLSIALFFVALYFPFQPKAGEPMAIANYFAYLFLGVGGILIFYTAFLAYRFMRAGSLKGTSQDNASRQDIIDLGNKLGSKIDNLSIEIHSLVTEIRQDRNGRSNKPTNNL